MLFRSYTAGFPHSAKLRAAINQVESLQELEQMLNTYKLLDEENENGFIFYQSEDENSGQFTYFAFSPDTMGTTYHLEFRYSEDLNDLQSWFDGNYAYWNAAPKTRTIPRPRTILLIRQRLPIPESRYRRLGMRLSSFCTAVCWRWL